MEFMNSKRAELGQLGWTTSAATIVGAFAVAYTRGALTQEVIQSVLLWNGAGLVLGAGLQLDTNSKK